MPKKQTSTGKFTKKRGDSLIGSIERDYGVDFGVRSDMKLSTYLKETGLPSLGKVLDKMRERTRS